MLSLSITKTIMYDRLSPVYRNRCENQLQANDEDRCRFMESLVANVVHPINTHGILFSFVYQIITPPNRTHELRLARPHAISLVNIIPWYHLVWWMPWIYNCFASQQCNIINVLIIPKGWNSGKNRHRDFVQLFARDVAQMVWLVIMLSIYDRYYTEIDDHLFQLSRNPVQTSFVRIKHFQETASEIKYLFCPNHMGRPLVRFKSLGCGHEFCNFDMKYSHSYSHNNTEFVLILMLIVTCCENGPIVQKNMQQKVTPPCCNTGHKGLCKGW